MQIVPADLNGFLFQMEINIAQLSTALGNTHNSKKFQLLADARQEAMDDVLWDMASNQWRDFILEEGGQRGTDGVVAPLQGQLNNGVYASNWVPLWCGVRPGTGAGTEAMVDSFKDSGLILPCGE